MGTKASRKTAEHLRLEELSSETVAPWHRWGPFVSERTWGTVREDYSHDGTAWDFLSHEKARSKAYRWGEDGIAGICDRYQILVFALALWNGSDPILKERFFGLTPSEGNHGEDVKEYYFYLDSTPTYSYMKMLYKYPQRGFPYGLLVEENRRRRGSEPEFELLDTKVFDEDRYFDVFVEYAKAAPEDLVVRIEAINRGPEAADLHILPHLWFRNAWAWSVPPSTPPSIRPGPRGRKHLSLVADDQACTPISNLTFEYRLGVRYLYGPAAAELLFTDNETNGPVVFGPGAMSRGPYVKDAFHRHVINHEDCTNPAQVGTKACLHLTQRVPAGKSMVVRLRLTPEELAEPLQDVDEIIRQRKDEADDFYSTVHPPKATPEEQMIQRQALSGMLWSRQIYIYDVAVWLEGDNPNYPPPASRKSIRNTRWRHLNSMRILAMPDKWEYPWFAAWDLAFHCLTLTLVDPYIAKHNLWLLLFEQFQHPNGQIPAYEWEFSDLNPPVQAWACWKVFNLEKRLTGKSDLSFLERCLHKLLMNFAWWVNREDSQGLNVFEGGFLGLDNITVVDRSEQLPGGAILEQSDATGWMAFFCLYMMRIALVLARENRVYEGLATKFFEHYIYIASAMKKMGAFNYQLWDDSEGFFYDVLRYPDGTWHKFRVRSLVGLIPLFAVDVLQREDLEPHPHFLASVDWFIQNRPELVGHACYSEVRDGVKRHILSIVDRHQLDKILRRLWDPREFLSEAGMRSLSKFHEQHPFIFEGHELRYEAAEAFTKIKGGNSNWRGPIWFPTSYLLIESLVKFSDAFGPEFAVEVVGEQGRTLTPREMAEEIANRMIRLFKRDAAGRRAIHGESKKFLHDPNWRDCLLFHEYFHGDTGAGLGASHQTGWTGLIANLIDEWRR